MAGGWKNDFIYWAVSEYVPGRKMAPVQITTARNIVGTISRLLTFARSGVGIYQTLDLSKCILEHPINDWAKFVTAEKVKQYADFLTSQERSPKYIADEVTMLNRLYVDHSSFSDHKRDLLHALAARTTGKI